jgi:hypothetical protein
VNDKQARDFAGADDLEAQVNQQDKGKQQYYFKNHSAMFITLFRPVLAWMAFLKMPASVLLEQAGNWRQQVSGPSFDGMLKRESIGVWLDVKPRQKMCGVGIA